MEKMEKIAVVTIIASLLKKKINNKNLQSKTRKGSIWCREWLKRRNASFDLAHLVLKELQLEDQTSFEKFCRLPQIIVNCWTIDFKRRYYFERCNITKYNVFSLLNNNNKAIPK